MTKYLLKVQLKVSQIPHNFFGPSAQIGQSFGMFLKKVLITCVHCPWFEQVNSLLLGENRMNFVSPNLKLHNRCLPYFFAILGI